MFKKLIHVRWVFSTVLLLLVLAAVSSYYFINMRENGFESDVFLQNENQIISANLVLTAYMNRFSSDTNMIASLVEDTVVHGSEEDEPVITNLEEILSTVLEYNDFAYQIRIIDHTGYEFIRFDRINKDIFKSNDLQYKGDRYYFEESLDLGPKDLYMSPIDLNVEHGEIEVPYVPTIRMAKKVYLNEELYGLVVINFNIKNVIDQLKKFHEDELSKLEIINNEGYWISHYDSDYEWGFMFPSRNNLNIKKMNPDVWNFMLDNTNGRMDKNSTWLSLSQFTYDRLEQLYLISSVEKKQFYQEDRTSIIGIIAIHGILWILLVVLIRLGYNGYNQRVESNLQLEKQAMYDVLTGIPNRLSFNKDLSTFVQAGDDQMFAIFFLDLDGFKLINDAHGHEIGDFLLKDVANRLRRRIRETDMVYRIGGDEFTLIIDKIKMKSDVEIVAKKIIETISHRYVYDDIVCQIGVSIGISVYPIDGTTENQLLNLADHHMYEIKKTGKNHYYYIKEEEDLEEYSTKN